MTGVVQVLALFVPMFTPPVPNDCCTPLVVVFGVLLLPLPPLLDVPKSEPTQLPTLVLDMRHRHLIALYAMAPTTNNNAPAIAQVGTENPATELCRVL